MPGEEDHVGANHLEWLDQAPDAVLVHDLEGKISYWNHGAETLYGWSKSQALGAMSNELLRTIFPVPLGSILEELRQTGKWQGELRHMVRSGDLIVVSSHWNACGTDSARPEILEINRDITDQKQLLEGLRSVNRELESLVADLHRSKDLFRGLLESAPDAMVIVRKSGEIALVNAQTERQFGYTAQELLGQDIEILMPERFHRRHLEERAEYTVHPRVRPIGQGMELVAVRKNGEEFPVEISLSPLSSAEGLLVSSAIRDISGHKRIEGKLQERIVELERELLTRKPE
jgi:PAS domain S-box-containing protein